MKEPKREKVKRKGRLRMNEGRERGNGKRKERLEMNEKTESEKGKGRRGNGID